MKQPAGPIPASHAPFYDSPIIDLDHNATTRPSDATIAAMERALRDSWHNPSSIHRAGQAARREVELARERVAALIGARPRDVVFTSGGTESIDLAVRGTIAAWNRPGTLPTLITSRVEHACVRDLAEDLAKRGSARVLWADLLPGGLVNPRRLAGLLDDSAALVCVQWSNNETGAVQPVCEIGESCRGRGVPLLCDGVQWVGKMPASVEDAPFDMLAISAHKLHGPKGVGALWIRPGTRVRPAIHGSQELGRRGGTENVPGIAGFGAAAEESMEWLGDQARRQAGAALRDRFERRILAALPEASINGPTDVPGTAAADSRPRVWNTTNIAFPRLEAEALLLLLSERGVWASAGAACSSGSLDPSPVLLAMGVPEERAHGSLRFSISRHTTADEVDRAAEIVIESVRTLSRSMTA